jgi:hypothetical protein
LAHPLETTGEVSAEFRASHARGRRSRPDHQVGGSRQERQVIPDEMAELALHPVADHGIADRLAHDQAHPRAIVLARAAGIGCVVEQVHDQGSTARPPARTHGAPEGVAVAQPLIDSEHGAVPMMTGMSALAQTARLLRPLRRRAEMMARPARVRMRRRNPCTLWRRRLFGW